VVDYHGIRQPAYGDIDAILARMSREQPEVWQFVTNHGRLWRARAEPAMAA